MIKHNLKEISELIDLNTNILRGCRESKIKIECFLLMSGCPDGYSEGTSYLDADCIHGTRKEYHVDDYQRLVEELSRLDSMIILQEDILNNLNNIRNTLVERVKGLKGLEYKVGIKYYLEGKSLKEIADELGYSYDYIKEINSRI
ncbi:DNA-binding response regulator [Clostridium cadaveris]|uniref:DNA-binding response regulator n=1 Tax=Clostridium cadaveris TaxID=1529 RepID=UPI001E3E6F9B|nr:DNA-binding response regulator [Clostridium cadaveris]UFH65574.1 DNA-binding response regulator [Clostridium cadaveris]